MTDASGDPTAPPAPGSGETRFASEKAELEAWIRETPAGATVKGMYVDSLFTLLEQRGAATPTDKRYFAFKDYPLRDLMRFMVDAVDVLYPGISPHDGMTALGRLAFPTLANTTIGKVIFSVAGQNWVRALNLVKKAYEVSISPGSVTVGELTATDARVELREIWNFGSSYQVGVFEGAMEQFGVRGSVRAVTVGRRCDVDLLMHWEG